MSSRRRPPPASAPAPHSADRRGWRVAGQCGTFEPGALGAHAVQQLLCVPPRLRGGGWSWQRNRAGASKPSATPARVAVVPGGVLSTSLKVATQLLLQYHNHTDGAARDRSHFRGAHCPGQKPPFRGAKRPRAHRKSTAETISTVGNAKGA